jgi:hypothetical protein
MSSPDQSDACLAAELTQRLNRFFHHLDERRYDDMIAMFTPDGRWFRQGQWLADPQAIRRALDARPAAQRTRHVMTNAFIASRDELGVRVEAYMTAYRHDGPVDGVPRLPGPFRFNLVTTVFRKVDGDWQIAEQRMVPEFEFIQ